MLKQIETTYPDVRVAFKHYPLPFHPMAKPAAIASLAAQKQNKFWEMHDLLYANQKQLDAASLRRYAESLGLDLASYDKVVADPESGRVMDQAALDAQRYGVSGTPSMFVNGVQAPMWDFATVQKLIVAAKSGGDVSMVAGEIRAEQAAQQAKARANQPPPPDYNKVYPIDIAGAPSKGPADAPVVIVEFSDYQ